MVFSELSIDALSEFSMAHTHAVMFHHFHNEQHPIGQGSLSTEQFEAMIDWLADRYSILSADEYIYKLENSKLNSKDICLTFDDALLCQSEIAAPILRKRNIQAFFFVYSSPFVGDPDFLEIYRYFRTTEFDDIDDFYEKFFYRANVVFSREYDLAAMNYDGGEYLKSYPFYSPNDKWFRFLRDNILGKERYEEIMRLLMLEYNFHPDSVMKKLWMNDGSLRGLMGDGHTIGLHSYSHPTTLHLLDKKSQEREYAKNYKHLSELLGVRLTAMSHPCGNYNADTLDVLNSKNIKIGFRSNNSIKEIRSNLEIPREDHSNVIKEMGV